MTFEGESASTHDVESAPPSATSPSPQKPVFGGSSRPATPLPAGGVALVDALLRERANFLDRARAATDPVSIVRTLVVIVMVSAGVFGVAVGLFRPGWQIVSSAGKLPLLLLLTAALATPAMTGIRLALGQSARFRDDVLLVLATVALVSLGLATFAPVMLLAVQWGASYHQVVILSVLLCAFAGAGGLIYFLNNLALGGRMSTVLATVALTIFTLVGTQLAWTIRPFVARPRAAFEWVRPLEGSFLDAVSRSLRSAQGDYDRPEAPLPPVWRPEEARSVDLSRTHQERRAQ